MVGRTTLRDIAKVAGVSAVTVHKVLYAKGGVSDEMRAKVLKLASEMNYSVNTAASSLKRRETHIAVVLQGLSNPENFFFRKMWDGVEKAEKELRDYKVRITRFECEDNWEHQDAILCEIGQRKDIDGVILHAWDEEMLNPAIDYLWRKGIPVVTVNSDASDSMRVACVSASNERVGRLAAELLARMAPDGGQMLVVGGGKDAENIKANRKGFSEALKKWRPKTQVAELYNFHDKERFRRDFLQALEEYPDLTGVYVTTSRDTFTACDALRKTRFAGRLRVVGSDAFEEMIPFFDEDILHATIWKDQETQAQQAILLLYRYLSKRTLGVEPIKIGIIMRHNLEDYL